MSALRELNYRMDGGIEVSLLWNSDTGDTFVAVSDTSEDSEVVFPVAGKDAGDAFRHPYAYLSRPSTMPVDHLTAALERHRDATATATRYARIDG